MLGILYKVHPDIDPDTDPGLLNKRTPHLQKKRTLYQKSFFDKVEGADFKYENTFKNSTPKILK